MINMPSFTQIKLEVSYMEIIDLDIIDLNFYSKHFKETNALSKGFTPHHTYTTTQKRPTTRVQETSERGEEMDGKIDQERNIDDDLLMPGFRFHPTDEELVEFYLKRKVQHQPIPAELIKLIDIYKYDPWDLPKLTSLGEKEWYFYCPRERKYKNSARPNRVTEAGFWKATGTDRPIYSSSSLGIRICIGFKKSLVFYRGRAAKCMKTDWMMHEFRLVSAKMNVPSSDSLALCRIFKKAVSMANKALSYQNESTPVNSDSFETISDIDLSSYRSMFASSSNNCHLSGTSRTDHVSSTSSMFIDDLSPESGMIGFAEQQLVVDGDSSRAVQEIIEVDDEEERMEKDSWGFSFNLPLVHVGTDP